jgi:hypothetical protein
MFLEIAKVVILLGGIAILARWGIHWAAVAVGIAFGFNAITGVWMVVRDGPSPLKMIIAFVQPLLACAVMALAVEGARFVLWELGIDAPAARLIVEVLAGAGAYVAAALVICRGTARDLIALARDAMVRRRPEVATA